MKTSIILLDGLPRFPLIDVCAFGSITKEASKFIKRNPELNELRTAEGYVANALLSHLMMQLTFTFPCGPYSYRIFTKEERAIRWLRKHKQPSLLTVFRRFST